MIAIRVAVAGIAVVTMAGCSASAPDRASRVPGRFAVGGRGRRRDAAPARRGGVVVTIGDSIMAGLGLDADESWPTLVARDTAPTS
jgi:hypothetical protein